MQISFGNVTVFEFDFKLSLGEECLRSKACQVPLFLPAPKEIQKLTQTDQKRTLEKRMCQEKTDSDPHRSGKNAEKE